MSAHVLKGKRILAVDDEADVLEALADEISDACPDCVVEKASTFEEASRMLDAGPYDLAILDIMGVRGFDLLEAAVKKGLRVAMLTAHALSPEALERSYRMGARAYLPKEMLTQIVPFLEEVLQQDREMGWRRLMTRLKGFFDERFESDWEKKSGLPWHEWGKLG